MFLKFKNFKNLRVPGIDPRAICLEGKRANHLTKGLAYESVAKILQMVQNQTCKQNEIPSSFIHSFIHSFIPKCFCYSDRSNPDGLQLDAPEADIHNSSATRIA